MMGEIDPKGFYREPAPRLAGRSGNQARESGEKTFRVSLEWRDWDDR